MTEFGKSYLDRAELDSLKTAFDLACSQLRLDDESLLWASARRKRLALLMLELVEHGRYDATQLISESVRITLGQLPRGKCKWLEAQ